MEPISNPVLSCIFSRKSVRHYIEKPLTKDILELLMKAGMAAPTARNMQPWAFIGITDREILSLLASKLPYAKMLPLSGGAIVVCGDLNKRNPHSDPNLWVQDCSAAAENILLAAESMELGGVWTACYPYRERWGYVQKVLELPDNIVPLCLISLGYPAGIETPKDKFRSDLIHWEKW